MFHSKKKRKIVKKKRKIINILMKKFKLKKNFHSEK